ncbi:MAG TPA: tRNA epoxyqueuosine(34) reductase QueG [Candidatus Eisenbacteria bacterium]
MTNPAEYSRLIREAALRHGFHHVGIARAREVRHADEFRAWLADGRHASMSYMEKRVDERLDPELLDPAYQTIVSVASSYFHDNAAPAATEPASSLPAGRIARYAHGADYHNVLGKQLRKLLKELRMSLDGCDGRAWVDTGPVMDRAWASRAGIGWWGKHTTLVSRTDGSWLVLGTMALTIECEPDEPHEDFCGSCHRCIDACPTKAIVAERELDARLCISYWTIEHRGTISEAMRPAIGDWIFGCDLCLEVCPWNRFAQAGREARFAAREDRAAPALEPLLDLDDAAFRIKFNGSPIQRATRDGFVRNVCVALGNVGTPRNVRALERIAGNDASEVVREHAHWGIQRIQERSGE